ncbi:major facilitator superfamily domain-containing protein [Nemania serpens]|nr:major facilitator superfamily domain-containing protein [Nemania serpens]
MSAVDNISDGHGREKDLTESGQVDQGEDVEKQQGPAPAPSPDGSQTPSEDGKGRTIRGVRWLIICIAIYTTCTLYGLDTTIAADIQGPIVESLGHVEQLAWVGAGFPLGSVSVILFLGKLYETFNSKWNLIITVILFEVGSALCGAAPSMTAIIIGRVIAGSGGSGIYLGSLQYFALMTGDKERGFYMSLVGAFWGLGAVLGPIIGGAFSQSSATWRWAFYINLPIGAITILPFIFWLPSFHPIQGVSVMSRLKTIDFVGFILGAGTWVTFLLALTMAGGSWPWKDGRTIATFIVFGVVLVAYAVQQTFSIFTTPARRLFPVHLLRDRTQVLLYVVTAAGTTSVFVVIYYLPIYFQFVNGDGAITAAVRLLPFVVVSVVFNISSGSFLHLIKFYSIIYIVGGIFLIAGGGPLVVFMNPSSPTSLIYGLTVLVAVGGGITMTTAYTIATHTLAPADAGAGINLQNVAQIGGQVIALATAGQIYQSLGVRNLSTLLAGRGFSDFDIHGAVAGAQSTLFTELTGELRNQAILAITQAMDMAVVLVPVAGGVMLLAGLAMKREKVSV